VDDLDRLAADFERAGDDLEGKAERLVRGATLQTDAFGKANAAVRTGFMRSSITSEFDMAGDTKRGEVGPTAHYSAYLEYGTSRMSPRPFMNKAADVVEPQFYAGAAAIAAETLDAG
jgi:HK97 gp10 family phage protein